MPVLKGDLAVWCIRCEHARAFPSAGIAAATAQLALWDQCGGMGGNCKEAGACVDGPYPSKACSTNASCQRQDEWYWQCLPAGSGSQPSGRRAQTS